MMDAKQMKKLARELRLPGNTTVGRSSMLWEKRRGHAGAGVLARVREAAYACGFQQWDGKCTSNADGSRVGHGTVYKRGDVTLTLDSHYGVVADENRFMICVTVVQPVVG